MTTRRPVFTSSRCTTTVLLYCRGGNQREAGGRHPGGAGLVPGPAGEPPDPQERLRHGRQQVQADVEQGAERVQ